MLRLRRRITRLLTVSAVVLVGPAALAGNTIVERELVLDETIAGGVAPLVENLLGSIRVQGGGPAGAMRIEARVVAEAESPEAAEALAGSVSLATLEPAGSRVVRVRFPVDRHTAYRLPRPQKGGPLSRWLMPLLQRATIETDYGERMVTIGRSKGAMRLAVHLEVAVPYDVEASFRQLVGTLECSRLRGRTRAEVQDGRVLAVQLHGELHARTRAGAVEIQSFRGDLLALESAGAELMLTDLDAGTVRLRTGEGEIQARRVLAGELRIETESGDVTIEDVESETLDANLGSGDAELSSRLRRTKTASLRSSSGDVTLRIGRLSSFDLDAQTGSGSIDARGLDLVPETTGGRERLRHRSGGPVLQVSTETGKIVVRPL